MGVTLKCAACGADVEFEELSPTIEETCPGCQVQVRYREGDEQMAIPVSMTLPEKFKNIDLASVADKSSLLIGRYRKQAAGEEGQLNTDLVLAKALESLATSISHLEARLGGQESGGERVPMDEPGPESASAGENPEANGANLAVGAPEGQAEVEGEVVHLDPEQKEETLEKVKALPVGAQVLVRREAAREAHQFRREKHSQADWDERAEPARTSSGFGWLMERYPKSTVLITLALAGFLIPFTIITMKAAFAAPADDDPTILPQMRTTSLAQLMADDPEAAMAETIVRGFLNATSAETAAPFVYELDSIRKKFEKYYRPIATPGDYRLSERDRERAPDGKHSVFVYKVEMPGERSQLLVVLPEGEMPKVYWEFFAEIGDISWEEFHANPPTEPVEMRVWVYPFDQYFAPYEQEDWQGYVLHDYPEKHLLYAYADRRASGRLLAEALKDEPETFDRRAAVMARVKIAYRRELPSGVEGEGKIVELEEVVASSWTSWLPQRFQTLGKKN